MDPKTRKVAIALGAAVLLAAVAYPVYFNWWDHHSCSESGGFWDEAQDKCIEPDHADIPNTSESALDRAD